MRRVAGDADAIMEAAIEAGAEDVTSDENGHVIICAFEDIGDVTSALEASLGQAESCQGDLATADRHAGRRGPGGIGAAADLRARRR